MRYSHLRSIVGYVLIVLAPRIGLVADVESGHIAYLALPALVESCVFVSKFPCVQTET
jgi:hypothetical protein